MKGRKVEEPVPEATDDQGCNNISDEDMGHPIKAEVSSRTKGRIGLQATLGWEPVDADVGQAPGSGGQ